MKIVVTGSSGFIGRHLVNQLSRDGHQILGIDIQPPASGQARFSNANIDIRHGDILAACLADFQPQVVFHLAARTDLDETQDLSGYSSNIEGVKSVVEAVRATPSVKRAIYTSSQLVCRIGYRPNHDEDYAPNTLYGKSKVLTERIVRERDGGGVTWCLVRPTTVWGPGMSAHFQRFFRYVYEGRYFHIGRASVHQPYGYVENVVYQYLMLMAADSDALHRHTLYLADYDPLSLRDWTEALKAKMGGAPLRIVPLIAAKALARIGDGATRMGYASFPLTTFRLRNLITEYSFDTSLTRELCGELPFDMEYGVKETVAWLHRDGIIPPKDI